MNRRPAAMTLVELMLALTIFAIISTAILFLLEGAALAPDIVKRTRAFLEALRPVGEPAVAVRAKPTEALFVPLDALASKRRLDARARDVLARVLVGAK